LRPYNRLSGCHPVGRTAGDVDILARRTSKAEITPLVAVVLAVGGVPAHVPKPRIHTLKG
jgi:hypothetical protein